SPFDPTEPAGPVPLVETTVTAAFAEELSHSGAGLPDAIRAAPDGATPRISAGTYREPIVLDRSIRLVGDGGDVVLIARSEPCVTSTAIGAAIENIALRREGGGAQRSVPKDEDASSPRTAPTVTVSAGRLRLVECKVESDDDPGGVALEVSGRDVEA